MTDLDQRQREPDHEATAGPVVATAGQQADCAVIVVTYNSAAEVGALLDSLPAAAAGLRLRVLVVDNDSADATAAVVARRPWARLVPSGANLGYAGGINVGREQVAPTRTVAILNPDLELTPGSLRRLVETAVHSGAAVPRMLDRDGRLFPSLRREPSVSRMLGDALFGARWPARPGFLAEMVRTVAAYERPADVEWATGAALVLSATADAVVGPWDARRFFLYSEETDYCRRLREAGFTVRYLPEAVVRHHGGGSGGGPALVALGLVSRIRYFGKYHGRFATGCFAAAVAGNELLRLHRPGNRRALAALLSRRSRAALPGASTRPDTTAPPDTTALPGPTARS